MSPFFRTPESVGTTLIARGPVSPFPGSTVDPIVTSLRSLLRIDLDSGDLAFKDVDAAPVGAMPPPPHAQSTARAAAKAIPLRVLLLKFVKFVAVRIRVVDFRIVVGRADRKEAPYPRRLTLVDDLRGQYLAAWHQFDQRIVPGVGDDHVAVGEDRGGKRFV